MTASIGRGLFFWRLVCSVLCSSFTSLASFGTRRSFNELNSFAVDGKRMEAVTESFNRTGVLDTKTVEMAMALPARTESRGVVYVKKAFVEARSELPHGSYALVSITACFTFFVIALIGHYGFRMSLLNTSRSPQRSALCGVMFFTVAFMAPVTPCIVLGINGGLVALCGFYAALFTWIYTLKRKPYHKLFRVSEEGPLDPDKCKMIADYYSRLLSFVLAIFSGVTILLAWYVSQLLTQTNATTPTALGCVLTFLFLHDIYGSAWLLGVVAPHLVKAYVEVSARATQTQGKK